LIAQLDHKYIYTRPLKAIARLNSYVFIEGRPITTRGQWINPLLFTQFDLVKRIPQLKKVEQPIYIIGMGRSGSTILGKVLSMHPQVAFLNEPKALWYAVYPNEDIIGNYSRSMAHYRLDENDVTPTIKRSAHRLYGYSLFITASSRVVDKYPEMIFRTPFLKAIFPDAKFVFLVRNGWDTIASVQSWSQREGMKKRNEIHDWWGADKRKWQILVDEIVDKDPEFINITPVVAAFSNQEDMAAVEWTVTMRQGLRLLNSIPRQIHLVRFEELVTQPKRIIGEIVSFCQLPVDNVLINYAKRTLSQPQVHGECALHPAIRPLFINTMRELNYL